MNIHHHAKILKNLPSLSGKQLSQLIHQSEIEIANYKIITENYPPERYEKYYIPYVKRWNEFHQKLLDEQKRRENGTS